MPHVLGRARSRPGGAKGAGSPKEGIGIGSPATRDDLINLLPTVFDDAPTAGAEVARSSLRMTGMAPVVRGTLR